MQSDKIAIYVRGLDEMEKSLKKKSD